jgi:hypothetical protein
MELHTDLNLYVGLSLYYVYLYYSIDKTPKRNFAGFLNSANKRRNVMPSAKKRNRSLNAEQFKSNLDKHLELSL